MNRMISSSIGAAAIVSLSMAAFAQTTGQQSTASQTPSTTASAPSNRPGSEQQVTIVGCVQREADYRKARDAGKGGVAGTGVGVENEFVLMSASASTGAPASSPAAKSGAAASTPIGTGGAASEAYELTGPNEGQVASFVGKRVEIMGKVKPAETAAGAPTGGPTAGAPPRGVDVTSPDLKLRELEVTSVRETAGTCSQ